jgi:hypothetical protein
VSDLPFARIHHGNRELTKVPEKPPWMAAMVPNFAATVQTWLVFVSGLCVLARRRMDFLLYSRESMKQE